MHSSLSSSFKFRCLNYVLFYPGIGLEGHEAPYLRGGSKDLIQTGHTFSNEPGIYIEEDVGVRLEDIFYIAEDGSSIFLTEGVGGPAISPWKL